MKRIRRDKLIKELKDIYFIFNEYSKTLSKDCKEHQLDVTFFFGLKDLSDLIQKLEGTYKTLEERLADFASKHLNEEPNLKTVQYKFKPVKRRKKNAN